MRSTAFTFFATVWAAVWFLLAAACYTPRSEPGEPPAPDPSQQAIEIALGIFEGVGDVVLRTEGYAAFEKYAPDLIPLVDVAHEVVQPDLTTVLVPPDGVITFAEVKALAMRAANEPGVIGGIIAASYYLRRRSR